ncbi:MAG: CarD family transcriptional regulator [candidate division NC10 bacterium]|nr:CarD family transcriptional regulator [candidate division NC10 bacterium]
MFHIGDKVVYPAHGVGLIQAIEEKEVSGLKQSFYVLRLLGSEMTIMVPTAIAERNGLRGLMKACDVPKVLEILRKNDVVICPNWNRRFKDNLERIKTGSPYEVAEVMRILVLLQKERNLSFGEKKMLENVRQLLVMEICHAVNAGEQEIKLLIEEAIASA